MRDAVGVMDGSEDHQTQPEPGPAKCQILAARSAADRGRIPALNDRSTRARRILRENLHQR
jgi:hypothetical protein